MKAHPNKLPFIGVLGLVDVASDKAPMGARGHRVLMTSAAARASLHTLIGMGINVGVPCASSHNPSVKIGVIDAADLVEKEIIVSGYIFHRDCPGAVKQLSASADNGMSYELANVRVADMRADVWTLTEVTFTGAAVLLRDKAAYKLTDFILVD